MGNLGFNSLCYVFVCRFKWQNETWALRQRFAEYGHASGVNPGLLWPTKEEVLELRREEVSMLFIVRC